MVQACPELRVVLMSATVDTSMFADYFGSCQIVEVFGRQFPVQRELTLTARPQHGCPTTRVPSGDCYLGASAPLVAARVPAARETLFFACWGYLGLFAEAQTRVCLSYPLGGIERTVTFCCFSENRRVCPPPHEKELNRAPRIPWHP